MVPALTSHMCTTVAVCNDNTASYVYAGASIFNIVSHP